MNPQSQTIPCPVCNTPIIFDTNQLLMGVQFACPNCDSAVGLAQGSNQNVRDTMEKFDKLKDRLKK